MKREFFCENMFALLGIAVYVRTWIIVVCASTIVRIKPCGALTSLEHVNNVNCTCNIHVRYVMSFSFEKFRHIHALGAGLHESFV